MSSSVAAVRGRALLILVIYVSGVIVVGAVSAPWVHTLFDMLGVEWPFHKFCLRWVQGLALVGLWPALRSLGFGLRRGFGLQWRGQGIAVPAASIARGICWGAGCMLVVACVLLVLEVRVLKPGSFGLAEIGTVIVKAALTAVVVSAVEELWFRGGLYTVARAAVGAAGAIAFTAALYAAVHFVRADTAVDPAQAGWLAGFEVLGHSLNRFASRDLSADFAALMVAGLWLGLGRWLSGSLWLCIGIHAGWVLVIQSVRRISTVHPEQAPAGFVGQFDGFIGWFAASVLLVIGLLFLRRSSTTSK